MRSIDQIQQTVESLPYDYFSIMHYNTKAFAVDEKQLTIVPNIPPLPSLNLDKIGSRTDLSDMDILKLKALYKCK